MNSIEKSMSVSYIGNKMIVQTKKDFDWIIADSIDQAMDKADELIDSFNKRKLEILEMVVKNKPSGLYKIVRLRKEELRNTHNWRSTQYKGDKLFFSTSAVNKARFGR